MCFADRDPKCHGGYCNTHISLMILCFQAKLNQTRILLHDDDDDDDKPGENSTYTF